MAVVSLSFLGYYLVTQRKLSKENIYQFEFGTVQRDVQAVTVVVKGTNQPELYLHREDGNVDLVVSAPPSSETDYEQLQLKESKEE